MTDAERRRGRFPLARFPWTLTVCVAPALILLLSLGVWQAQRLAWKQGLIAAAEAAAQKPPALLADVLAEVLAEGGDPEFRRVIVDCPGLAQAPFVEMRTIEDGAPGVRLVSACRAEGAGGRVWLVDRGYVADAISARPPVVEGATDLLRIEAVIRRAPDRRGGFTPPPEGRVFHGRDAAAMARVLGVDGPVEPTLLFAETSTNPQWAALRPHAPPVAFSNNHLGYALTWFGLAAVLLGFYIALLRRRFSS